MLICPSGHENSAGQRFCGECGAPLTPASAGSPSSLPPPAGSFAPGPPPSPASDVVSASATSARSDPAPKRRRKRWLLALPLVVVVGAGVVVAVLATRKSDQEQYLASIADLPDPSPFGSDDDALKHAKDLCNDLDKGAEKKGTEADRLGVKYFCKEQLDGFRVLSADELRDENYLSALQEEGLSGDFAADRQALSNAEKVCKDLDDGAKAQGSEADKLGVDFYCDEYSDAFKILQTKRVTGTFEILDSDSHDNTIGGACEGDGGYGDLNSATAVIVRNSEGDEVARTALGSGSPTGLTICEFTFTFELKEGEETYILSIGDRGEFSYSWNEITLPGAVALTIG